MPPYGAHGRTPSSRSAITSANRRNRRQGRESQRAGRSRGTRSHSRNGRQGFRGSGQSDDDDSDDGDSDDQHEDEQWDSGTEGMGVMWRGDGWLVAHLDFYVVIGCDGAARLLDSEPAIGFGVGGGQRLRVRWVQWVIGFGLLEDRGTY